VAKRLIVGITGATGAIYARRVLEVVQPLDDWETHLVISKAGRLNLHYELDIKKADLSQLADATHPIDDIAAPIASGGFRTEGMLIIPCSMKTLSAVANGYGDNLISRAADVVLKERRPLIIVPREAPLNLAHLRNMISVTEMGGVIYPPVPAFYSHPKCIEDLVDETVGRVLGMVGIEIPALQKPWQGIAQAKN
jgi:4-hydroxy-3-polyprenylbenzoate decarboxylase